MKEKFFKEVLIPLIERGEQSVAMIELVTDTYGYDETINQERTRIVTQELINLKHDYEGLNIDEITTRFKRIIGENPAVKPSAHRKVYRWIRATAKSLLRRVNSLGRKREGDQDQGA